MRLQFVSDRGELLGVIGLTPKTFKTGSKGYFGQIKLEADDKRYQAQAQIVEIHSKPGASSPTKSNKATK